jgi:hypothetical protein
LERNNPLGRHRHRGIVKSERNSPLGRLGHRWQDIKTDLEEIVWEDMGWIFILSG